MRSLRSLIGLCDHLWVTDSTIEGKRAYYKRETPETIIRERVEHISVILKCSKCGDMKTRRLA